MFCCWRVKDILKFGWLLVGGCQLAKWELVDMGSLNGTLVNSIPVGAAHKANASVRQRGQPTALANGDIVTLGSSSNVLVSGVDQSFSVVFHQLLAFSHAQRLYDCFLFDLSGCYYVCAGGKCRCEYWHLTSPLYQHLLK